MNTKKLTPAMKRALSDTPHGFKLHIGSSDFVKGYYMHSHRRQTIDALVRRGLMRWDFKWHNSNGDKVYDLVLTPAGRAALEASDGK